MLLIEASGHVESVFQMTSCGYETTRHNKILNFFFLFFSFLCNVITRMYLLPASKLKVDYTYMAVLFNFYKWDVLVCLFCIKTNCDK